MFYPNNIKKQYKRNISHKNRGMDLESIINTTNSYYLHENKAVIYKKTTPIGVVDVNYEKGSKIIKKAYFKMPSTLDYNGLYRSKYIEFDAKETLNKTSFPLSNIHPHQLEHIKNILIHGGIVFLIIKMNNLYYYLKGEDLTEFVNLNKRKSIPYSYVKEKCYNIKESINPNLDYLKIIDKIYFTEE